jgi:O-antigen/teichoic acid export membrane protein
MQKIGRQLAFGAMWSLVGTVSSQAIALFATVLLARVLGQQGFGELSIVRMTVLMVSSFVGGGLAIAATKHVADFRERHPDRAGAVIGLLLSVAIILSSLGAVALLAMSTWLAETVLHAAYLGSALKIGSVMLITSTVSGVQNGALQGNAAFRSVAWIGGVEALITSALGITGALAMGVDGAMLGLAGGAFLTIVARQYLLHRLLGQQRISVTYKDWRENVKLLGTVAVPSMLLSGVIQPAEWLGRVLIARGPDGFNQVAIFSAAQSLATVTQLGPAQIATASLPVMAQLQSIGATSTFRMTLMRTTGVVLLCGLLVGSVIAVASKPLMGLYGESFADSSGVLIVLAVTYGVAVVTMVWGTALIAHGRTWSQLLQKCFWAVTMVGAAYLLADKGAQGLAYAYGVGNGVLIVIQLAAMKSLVRDNAVSSARASSRGTSC